MMMRKSEPLFLEQKGYRRRRAKDAAHLLPLLGVLLFILPIMRDPATTPENETAAAMLYLFGVWIMLIGLTVWLSGQLRGPDELEEHEEGGG